MPLYTFDRLRSLLITSLGNHKRVWARKLSLCPLLRRPREATALSTPARLSGERDRTSQKAPLPSAELRDFQGALLHREQRNDSKPVREASTCSCSLSQDNFIAASKERDLDLAGCELPGLPAPSPGRGGINGCCPRTILVAFLRVYTRQQASLRQAQTRV